MFAAVLIGVVALNVWADFIDRKSAADSDISALSLWTTIVQFLLVVPLLGLVELMPLNVTLWCAGVAAVSVLARAAWYHALSAKREQLSRLAPFTRLSSVMTLAMAFAVLGEPFTLTTGIGACIIVIGALMMSFRGATASFGDYLRENSALVLVAAFALSSAFINILYKFSLNVGVSIVTIYFFLKLFQFGFAALTALAERRLFSSYAAISDLPEFVQARVIQTVAALAYLFALQSLPMSVVVPITAAAGPILYILIEQLNRGRRGQDEARRSRMRIIDFVGVAAIVAGGILLAGGQSE